ncbi:MAG: polysaccharide pyruvyl transferase family protein [Planctomycetes bacterium]|nr:polysaccharide pyruvyl transferase family protein [Planctomycetota bacterium]
MPGRKRVGVLTFHRCINYGAYWQARCLVEALRSQQHDAVLLDHRSWRVDLREWTWGLRPVSPEFIPPLDFFRYAGKEWAFFRAAARLPRSRPFRLEQPATMEEFDVVLVGSDEVWSPKHAWYGDCPIFYGAGVRTKCLAAYGASFGGHCASEGLDAARSGWLRAFDSISVRDENSRSLVRAVTGRDVAVVLDPCLQFPVDPDPVRHVPDGPYVALYGYRFSTPFARHVQSWARRNGLRTISIGYRNDWADVNWLSAGPNEFAHCMGGAQVVATNFFHGCVFALRHAKPFVCEMLTKRSIKVQELMRTVGAESHLMTLESSAAVYEEQLERPMDATIMRRIDDLRGVSAAYLQGVLK